MGSSDDHVAPSEFIKRLKSGDLAAEPPISVEGIVKLSDKGQLLISITGDCDDWVAVPVDDIDSIRQVGHHRCGDDAYVVAHLVLRADRAPNGELYRAMFLSVLRGMAGMPGSSAPGAGPMAMRLGATDEWGDPIPPPGCKKRCGPAVCPNPSGRGTIWCTKCWVECPTPAPEFGSFYRGW